MKRKFSKAAAFVVAFIMAVLVVAPVSAYATPYTNDPGSASSTIPTPAPTALAAGNPDNLSITFLEMDGTNNPSSGTNGPEVVLGYSNYLDLLILVDDDGTGGAPDKYWLTDLTLKIDGTPIDATAQADWDLKIITDGLRSEVYYLPWYASKYTAGVGFAFGQTIITIKLTPTAAVSAGVHTLELGIDPVSPATWTPASDTASFEVVAEHPYKPAIDNTAISTAPIAARTGIVGTTYTAGSPLWTIPATLETGLGQTYTWSNVSSLPTGLSVNSDGEIVGTTTVSGAFTFTPTVTSDAPYNYGADTATQAVTIFINEIAAVTGLTPITGTVNTPYSGTVSTTGYPAPTLTLAGSVPGLSLLDNGNGTATLFGIPTAAGSYLVAVTATNSVGTDTESYTVTIAAASAPPVVPAVAPPTPAGGGEVYEDGQWRYIDGAGNVITGAATISGGRQVYYDNQGNMQFGLVYADGHWSYYNTGNGAKTTGEVKVNGQWYYFDPANNGYRLENSNLLLGGRTLYYGSNGALQFGLVYNSVNYAWQYHDTNNGNLLRSSEKYIDGKWYYFNASGSRVAGLFQTLGARTVYYDSNGAMQFGMVKIGTSWYYFNINNGDQLKSSEINVSGKWYYFNAVGTRVTNSWWTLGTRTVYYADDGMLFGSHSIGGVWYNFDLNNGARL